MQIDQSELFIAGLAKLFTEDRRGGVLNSIRLHMASNARRISVPVEEMPGRELRIGRLYVGGDIGHIRIFFEICDDKLMLWSLARASAGQDQ